jgi:hypothetical protein
MVAISIWMPMMYLAAFKLSDSFNRP